MSHESAEFLLVPGQRRRIAQDDEDAVAIELIEAFQRLEFAFEETAAEDVRTDAEADLGVEGWFRFLGEGCRCRDEGEGQSQAGEAPAEGDHAGATPAR